MYLTANVTEGETYKISDIKLSGNLILNEADMTKLIKAKSGEEFSRKKLEQSAQAMTAVLANIGYAFAQVTPIPSVDREHRLVGINFFVNPGKRVYVRHIAFKGNHSTQDEVMRREMRQLEGAWYSQAAIDRSKVRLQRLGYFKKVEIETPKVPGTDDQVDVNVAVEETSSGAFTFGLGYSQVYGIVLSVSVSQNNFLGTGDRAAFTASKSDFLTKYELSYYQPYLTKDGIGLGYDVSYSKLNQQEANLANYLSNTAAASTYVGIPVSESDTVNLTLGVSKTRTATPSSRSATTLRSRSSTTSRRWTTTPSTSGRCRQAGPTIRATATSIRPMARCSSCRRKSRCRAQPSNTTNLYTSTHSTSRSATR
jgi:outer membrane protein insertion porin family